MHENAKRLDTFYTAFARREADCMAAMYAEDAIFSDPVFPELRGAQIGWMWHMLCHRGKDLALHHELLEVSDTGGRVRWEARYTFGATGRKVHNQIDASFAFRDGLIVRHVDDFDFWRWSAQALGVPGKMFGWNRFLRNKVSAQALRGLETYTARMES